MRPPERTPRSRPRLGALFGCALCALFWAPACAPVEPLSRDSLVATRQIAEAIPKGAAEGRATKTLTDRGFTLSRLSSEQGANHLVVATFTTKDTMWQVGLVFVEAKVAATTVTVTDLNAGPK